MTKSAINLNKLCNVSKKKIYYQICEDGQRVAIVDANTNGLAMLAAPALLEQLRAKGCTLVENDKCYATIREHLNIEQPDSPAFRTGIFLQSYKTKLEIVHCPDKGIDFINADYLDVLPCAAINTTKGRAFIAWSMEADAVALLLPFQINGEERIARTLSDVLPALNSLSEQWQEKRQAAEERRRRADEDYVEFVAHLEQKHAKREQQILEQAAAQIIKAEEVLKNGGVLANDIIVTSDENGEHQHKIVNHLFRMYGIDVPLRTQGWINERLGSVCVGATGEITRLSHSAQNSNGRKIKCSAVIWDYLEQLVVTVRAASKQQEQEERAEP